MTPPRTPMEVARRIVQTVASALHWDNRLRGATHSATQQWPSGRAQDFPLPFLPISAYSRLYNMILYIIIYMRYKVRQLNSQSGYVQFSVGSTWISYNKMAHAVHQRVIQDSHLNVPYAWERQSISTGCPNLQQPLKFLQLWTETAAFNVVWPIVISCQ
jgi:hypothetical protein